MNINPPDLPRRWQRRGFSHMLPFRFATVGRPGMPNHPNRGRHNPSANPSPKEITVARVKAGLTQTEAGKLIHASLRTWQQWEAGDRRMHPAFWELFKLKLRARNVPAL
jgi:DNA-binding XRE family transcriptional regulator